VRLFHSLPPGVLHQLAAAFHHHRYPRGAFVFLEGEPAHAFNLLAVGRIKVVRETDDGREIILRLITPGEIFGGAGVWGEPTYPASAIAQEDAVVLQMPAAAFATLLESTPSFALALIRELATRLREAEARIRDLQAERVERRLARVLLRLAHKTGVKTPNGVAIGIPLTRQDLAELAGTTLSTASRTLSAWDQQGIVEAGRERVTIRKPHALTAIADEL